MINSVTIFDGNEGSGGDSDRYVIGITDLDYKTLEKLKHTHPTWRLLRAGQASLIISFMNKVFIEPNMRSMPQSELFEALEDELYSLNEGKEPKLFPKSAGDYLNDWANDDKGWLRKFYVKGSDEPHFDLTPQSEKAIVWLSSLTDRTFVGTESRLLTLFDLLKQIVSGSESDPVARIAELVKKREEINREIAQIEDGEVQLLDDTSVKDRFQQFITGARDLLGDFREVEQNFRGLDRSVRERIALFEGSKGELLGDIMGERDSISDSDQGRSFQAFWDFLMSSRRQEEFTELLEKVLSLPAVANLEPDSRTSRIHYDWLEAGENTQRTVALLSQQLRRFLDDSTWLENRRIMEILHDIEANTLKIREELPVQDFMTIERIGADIDLPLERPLYTPKFKAKIEDEFLESLDIDIDVSLLFAQEVVDTEAIKLFIRKSLQIRSQITLKELLDLRPLEKGLLELVVFLKLATDTFDSVVDEDIVESVTWQTTDGDTRVAELPRVVFVR